MLLPRRLRSYNQRGGHWSEYSDRKGWLKLLSDATFPENDGTYQLPVKGRVRLELQRLAPSKRYLLDKENLEISGKRLVDTLVELGYMIDDARKWCDGPWVTQGVSADKRYWTIVTLSPIAPFKEDPEIVVSPTEAVRRKLEAMHKRAVVSCADDHSTAHPRHPGRRGPLRRSARTHALSAQTAGGASVLRSKQRGHEGHAGRQARFKLFNATRTPATR